MFSSANKHRSSNHKSGWGSSRWFTSQAPAATPPQPATKPSESSVFDSSWELSHGCEVAELSDMPAEWRELAR